MGSSDSRQNERQFCQFRPVYNVSSCPPLQHPQGIELLSVSLDCQSYCRRQHEGQLYESRRRQNLPMLQLGKAAFTIFTFAFLNLYNTRLHASGVFSHGDPVTLIWKLCRECWPNSQQVISYQRLSLFEYVLFQLLLNTIASTLIKCIRDRSHPFTPLLFKSTLTYFYL